MANKKLRRIKLVRMTRTQLDRVAEERGELEDKIERLETFLPIGWTTIPVVKYNMLELQLSAMKQYAKILNIRLRKEEDEELQRLCDGKKPRKA